MFTKYRKKRGSTRLWCSTFFHPGLHPEHAPINHASDAKHIITSLVDPCRKYVKFTCQNLQRWNLWISNTKVVQPEGVPPTALPNSPLCAMNLCSRDITLRQRPIMSHCFLHYLCSYTSLCAGLRRVCHLLISGTQCAGPCRVCAIFFFHVNNVLVCVVYVPFSFLR